LLLTASDLLRPEGILVHSMRTFNPRENEAIVHHLLPRRQACKARGRHIWGCGLFLSPDGLMCPLPKEVRLAMHTDLRKQHKEVLFLKEVS
jgi:16S rRNA C967 or C1407 C5-methylase (RsmB/RsmF family)